MASANVAESVFEVLLICLREKASVCRTSLCIHDAGQKVKEAIRLTRHRENQNPMRWRTVASLKTGTIMFMSSPLSYESLSTPSIIIEAPYNLPELILSQSQLVLLPQESEEVADGVDHVAHQQWHQDPNPSATATLPGQAL